MLGRGLPLSPVIFPAAVTAVFEISEWTNERDEGWDPEPAHASLHSFHRRFAHHEVELLIRQD